MAQTADFGDYGRFPSASSTVNSTLRIGPVVDPEASAVTNDTATGDDSSGDDDEDGVTLPASAVQGGSGSLVVNVTNNRGSTAYLHVWIDWNNNGVLTDSGEQVASNTTISNGTTNSNRTINFTVPAGAVPGTVGVRVRLTSVSSPGPDGADGIGEVEDHLLTVAPEFALVVVNYNNNTISRFNGATGAYLANWSPSGLSAPNYGYRLSDNTFLVANGGSNTITKYNPFTGAYLGTLVSSGKGLNFPYQMAVGSDGSIYIANQNAGNVLRFDQNTGAVLATVLTTTNPAGFVFDTAGQMYVTQNTSAGGLRLYSATGTYLSTVCSWPAGENPRGLAWGPDGRLYVNVRNGNAATGRVDAISFPDRTRSTFVNMDSGSNPYTGIKWGPDGNLYVVDYGENELHVYSPAGTAVRTLTTSLSGPHAVAFTDISAATQDFGDFAGFAPASSAWSTTIRLGNECDTEAASRTSATANGDDIDDIDDEDGVILPDMIVAGTTGSVMVKCLNTSGAAARLNAWIDFNNDGVLDNLTERIIANQSVANGTNGTTLTYNFNVPADAVIGNVGSRFRLTSTSNPGATGSSGTGEVEDYLVAVSPATTDFGDYSGFADASSTVNSSLRLGALSDAEVAATRNAAATGDDTTGSDDEDGVNVPSAITQGTSNSLTVNVTNTRGSTAYLHAWIDFNRNGVLTDAGEQIASNTTISNGTTNSTRTINFTVPAGASLGVAGVRVRLTSSSSPGPDGMDGFGEVEDYVTTIVCPAPVISPATLPAGTRNVAYSSTLSASGGSGGPYTFSVVSGSLPNGLNLNASSGLISGSPILSGTSVFTVGVSDSSGCMATRAYSLVVETTGSIGSHVWVDADNDGVREAGEANVSGLEITLWRDINNDGDFVDSGEKNYATTTTNGSGVYRFDDLPAGRYRVRIDHPPESTPWASRDVDLEDNQQDGDSNGYQHPTGGPITSPTIEISNGESDLTVDFGLVPPACKDEKMVLYMTDLNIDIVHKFKATGSTGIEIPGAWGGIPWLRKETQDATNGITNPHGVWFNGYDVFIGGLRGGSGGTWRYNQQGQKLSTVTNLYRLTHTTVGNYIYYPRDSFVSIHSLSTGAELGRVNLSGTTANTWGITIGKDGFLYVADNYQSSTFPNGNAVRGSGKVFRIDPKPSTFTSPATVTYSPFITGRNDMTGLDTDHEGNLYLVEINLFDSPPVTSASKVIKFSPQGTILATYTETSVGDNRGVEDAWGLRWNPVDNKLYIATRYGDCVARLRADTLTYDGAFIPYVPAAYGKTLSLQIECATMDLGDLPDSSAGNGTLNYDTAQENGGPTHFVNANLRLGALVDGEHAAAPNNTATGDDEDNLDDEDGIEIMPSFFQGVTSIVPVRVYNKMGITATLSSFFDWNADGDFNDGGEKITTAIPNGTDGVVNVSVPVPATATLNLNTGARFRLSTTAVNATGHAPDGEVEDYIIFVSEFNDFGDYAAFPSASSRMNSKLKIGATTDPESFATTNAFATGDDITSSDDEDGVTLPAAVMQGTSSSMIVNVTNTTGATAYLNVWIDFNGNGVITDSGEQVAANVTIGNNTNASNRTVNFTVPAAARAGEVGVRVRLTSVSSPGVNGLDGTGEVEDHLLTIGCGTVSISPVSLPAAMTGVSYSTTLSAAPTAAYAWSVVSGALPAGLSLNASTGTLSGQTSATGSHTFTVRASTAAASTPELEFTTYNLDLNPGDTFNIRDYVVPKDGSRKAIDWSKVRFTYTDAGANDPTSPANWNLTAFNAGQPVTVTSADASAGGNSGTGSFRIYIVRDGQAGYDDHMEMRVDPSRTSAVNSAKASPPLPPECAGTRQYTLNICPAMTLSPAQLAPLVEGRAYSQVMGVSGGSAPYVYSLAGGSLPAGLSLSASGVISGTPQDTTSTSFTISATDSAGCVVSGSYSLAAVPNTDYGDFSLFGSASSSLNSNLFLGAEVDTEASPTTDATATGDDGTGVDDEDGVTMPLTIVTGSSAQMQVVVTNTTGSTAYLNAWVDFNSNGSLTDAGEQVASNLLIPNGATSATQTITFNTPSGASVGSNRGVRVRLTSTASPGSTGAAGSGEVEDYAVSFVAPTSDFGDYELFGSASSTRNSKLFMGALVDADPQPVADATATGDDLDGSDDEDGLTIPAITQGTNATLRVRVSNTRGSTAYLNAWIDFNGNGILTDPGEQVASNRTVSTGTSSANRSLSFTAPTLVKTSGPVGVRVRLTSVSSPGPLGQSGFGEVEDALASITAAYDYGDHSAFPLAASKVNSTLKIGSLTDAEGGLDIANAEATGDDLDGVDDEDGVTLPASLPQGGNGSMTVRVSNNSGATAYLNAWVDFNRNGSLGDAGEQIAINTAITTGTSNSSQVINFDVPLGAQTGMAGVRVRFTSVSSPGPDGVDGNGEVEDYVMQIVPPTTDFGDELDFADASSTVNPNLRLGELVDVEGAATKTADASGDDGKDQDDEDAVEFPPLTAGQPVTLPVSVHNTSGAAAYLNAWVDFNNNGTLTDPGEQIATNVLVPDGTSGGTSVLNFEVPTNAVTAATSLGTRFRLTNVMSPGPVGQVGEGEVEDHPVVILAPLTDFGDFSGAPDVSNTASTNLRLGALVDTEYASTRNAGATGDDVTGVDDEDGVTIPTMTAGGPATLAAVVTNNSGASAYLNAWIDFNHNGVFTDAGEQVGVNILVPTGTSNATRSVNLTVPAGAVTGVNLGVRVRLSNDVSPGSTGAGGTGEVEDYVTVIQPPTTDFGDFSSFGSASSLADNSLRFGLRVDTEYTPASNINATGDDSTGSDDEDGVNFPTLTAGAPVVIPLMVTNGTGSDAYINAWIDFNNNGSINDPGEQIATNVVLGTGLNNAVHNLHTTIPASALTGVNLGARFRLTSTTDPGTAGASGRGEVEDYVVIVLAPTTDFGDFSGFTSASQGVNPLLRMGAALDPEYEPAPNAAATGDDLTDEDDEDGVILPSMTAGQTAGIQVTVTNLTGANGYLNAWFDFNNNGVLTDTGEQIATNILIPDGTDNVMIPLSVAVPPKAVTGTPVGLRFRLSAPSGLGPTGDNPLAGEVEDHVVNIAAPTTDFGDHSGLAPASSTASANVLLGTRVDAEYAATANANATGDDITDLDDEDGVVMPGSLQPGSHVVVPVTVLNTSGASAYLHAWIDFDNDGVLDDALIADGGERLEAPRQIASLNTGTILREYWTGISGTSISSLTSHPSYPDSPTSYDYRTEFTAPVDWADNMGQRIRGWVYPPVSGEYTFWVSGDDETHLYLSTDASPANAALIARVPGWTGSQQWTKYAEQTSVKITLQAGRPYYIEGIMKEGGGGDSIAAAWELPGTSTGPVVIAGQYLAPWSANAPYSSSQEIAFVVPETASPGSNRAVRFRLTNSATTVPAGFSGIGEVEDYAVVITAPTNDFGDWSRTGSASNGVSSALFMGDTVDAEYAAAVNLNATGDDLKDSDDEDGVTLPSMIAGGVFSASVAVTNETGNPAYLNAWVDFNNNGDFTDNGEHVIADLAVPDAAGAAVLDPAITVPATAVTSTPVGVRFRLTADASPGPVGDAGGLGEVEDYVVSIAAPTLDQGDFSRFPGAASAASTQLRMGALVDTEYTATVNVTATGDDNTGSDDEDGVVLPLLMAGAPATLPVTVTNTTGAAAYLNVWVDFNNNGSINDPGEQVASNVIVASGTSDGLRNLDFTVPPAAVTRTPLGMRLRLTSVSSPGVSGTDGTGEVEDYVTTIAPPPLDYGDWSRLADAASTVDPGLVLGTLVDAEYVSTRNTTASGDDNTELDDEDGVVFPSMIAGAPATIAVTVTNTTGAPAYLNAWFDFNNNGAVSDAGEQIASNIIVPSGTTGGVININLTIPAGTVTGSSLGTRFRLTSVASPGAAGNAGLGEVEDHSVNVAVPVTDYGDWSGAPNASNLASSDLRMGALADTEYVPTKNAEATGDDLTASDDEDGVTIPSMLPGTSSALDVVVTNNTGSMGYLNAWIDFNGNGNFADPGEQIASNLEVASGTNGVARNVGFIVPIDAMPGTRGARFRLTDAPNPSSIGAGGTGEVEDHLAMVTCVPFAINPPSLTAPVVGNDYSQVVSSLGVHPPFVFHVSSGALPAGLQLDEATGEISGMATSSAPVSFTITGTDATGCTGSRSYTLTPACKPISISPNSLAGGTVGLTYSAVLTASGGNAPYGSWTVISGSLPAGLNLDAGSGLISGKPTAPVNPAASFTVRVTDAYGCQGTQVVSLRVCPAIDLTPSSLAGCAVGSSYSQTVEAGGGAGPYVFDVSSGQLPAGLSLDSTTGVISGIPNAAGASTFVVRATDSGGCTGTRSYTLTPACPVLALAPASLPAGYLGAAYEQTLLASNGAAPYSYVLQSGALPTGLFLSANGVISGVPSVTGVFTFTVRATDSYGCATSFDRSLVVRTLSLGNLVFEDSNNNGLKDVDEPGIEGAVVQLFATGSDHAIGGTGAAADVKVGTDIITPDTGSYRFTNVPPGKYYVKVTAPPQFRDTGGTPSTVDDDVDNNNDGAQPGGSGTPVYSPVIELGGGQEPVNDGDSDPDTNLSLDFGFWASMAVGNFVFLDINGDGVRNEGESLGNIYVELYAEGSTPGVDEPAGVGSSGCSCKGRYYIEGINAGRYFLHIPSSQFAPGMPLEGLLPMSQVVEGDDDVGQDLLFNSDPAVNGASTGVFELRPGAAPSGTAESGGEGFIDDEIDGMVDLTRDLGVVAPAGSGFAAGSNARRWLVTDENSLARLDLNSFAQLSQAGSMGGALDDADDDGECNLLEYALGSDPLSGVLDSRFALSCAPGTGVIEAVLRLPVATHDDVIIRLETLTDLSQASDPAAWKHLSMAATTTFNTDGTMTRHYSNLERLLVFLGADTGYVRVKVDLDADRNGVPEATAYSAVHAWSRQTFHPGTRSFSMPLLRPAFYGGRVAAVSGREVVLPTILLLPSGSYYLEVAEGPLAGHRFEIDATASSGNTLVLQESGAVLAELPGSRILVRPHWTLTDVLPPAAFAEDDRLLFFDSAAGDFAEVTRGAEGWTDGALSVGGRPFAAHAAVLATVRGTLPVDFVYTGEIRNQDLVIPLVPGTQLVASGWPVAPSAPVHGLRPGTSPEAADRLRLWEGDFIPGASGYLGYYLDGTSQTPAWTPQEGGSQLPVLEPFHGMFLIREEFLNLRVPRPW